MKSYTNGNLSKNLYHVVLAVKYELLKHMRSKRIVINLILAIVLPLLFYIIPKAYNMDFPVHSEDFAQMNLGFVTTLIIICAVFFAGDAIVSEFEKKTGLITFLTPQRKTSMFLGKYLAAFIAVLVMVSVYYMIANLEIIILYGLNSIPEVMVLSYLISLLYITSALSVVYIFSSIMKGTISSSLLSFSTLMMTMPIISGLLFFVNVEPWFLVTYSSGLITDVFSGIGTTMTIEMGGGGDEITMYSPQFNLGIIMMVLYAVGLYLVSIFITMRREVV